MPRAIRPSRRRHREGPAFGALVETARRLQAPGGCPWDRAQTVRTLLPHLIEETWEVFVSSRTRDRDHLREELGDVLYTVVFLTLLAEREGWFDLTALPCRRGLDRLGRKPPPPRRPIPARRT